MIVKMERAGSSEVLVPIYQATRSHTSEDTDRREDLSSSNKPRLDRYDTYMVLSNLKTSTPAPKHRGAPVLRILRYS
jgi:hypothetical protein